MYTCFKKKSGILLAGFVGFSKTWTSPFDPINREMLWSQYWKTNATSAMRQNLAFKHGCSSLLQVNDSHSFLGDIGDFCDNFSSNPWGVFVALRWWTIPPESTGSCTRWSPSSPLEIVNWLCFDVSRAHRDLWSWYVTPRCNGSMGMRRLPYNWPGWMTGLTPTSMRNSPLKSLRGAVQWTACQLMKVTLCSWVSGHLLMICVFLTEIIPQMAEGCSMSWHVPWSFRSMDRCKGHLNYFGNISCLAVEFLGTSYFPRSSLQWTRKMRVS